MKNKADMRKWRDKFQQTQESKPAPGTILRTFDGSPVRIRVDLVADQTPTMYAHAYVPCICGQPLETLNWQVRSINETSLSGLRCILLPQATAELIRRNPGLPSIVSVMAIRVIRTSTSGKSLLVEIADYGESISAEPVPDVLTLLAKEQDLALAS